MSKRRPGEGVPAPEDRDEVDALGPTSGPAPRGTALAEMGYSMTHTLVGAFLCERRFHVTRLLGRGGMGTVYEAFDSTRQCNVALKTLHHLNPTGDEIYQLKQEFRSLADVSHDNLVRLHEMFFDAGLWYFTMDLVAGRRFDHWVRPEGHLDRARLQSGLVQLLDGLEAIHLAGKLHRDVKPSNVLVSESGHVWVLDFGLVVDSNPQLEATRPSVSGIAGTAEYIAPEHASGHRMDAACDLYAVGVMLFEALTGRPPFMGTYAQILMAKHLRDAPPATGADVPADLAELCAALLSRDPRQRPTLSQLRSAISLSPTTQSRRRDSSSSRAVEDESPLFVGRTQQLAAMRAAYEAAAHAPVLLVVSGESGIGKTALCREFLRELRGESTVVQLKGRCFEHENVPFKAVDAVIDDLSRYLHHLPPEQVAALLPRDAFALSQLFPVLLRIPSFSEAPARTPRDPRERQSRAFAAFGELLGRIRDRQRLVVHIDDVQWIDSDSATLLRHLLVSPTVPSVLFVISHRSDGSDRTLLEMVFDGAAQNREIERRSIQLSALAAADAERLASRLLADDSLATSHTVAAEARGNPYFVMELARSAGGALQRPDDLSLAALLRARVDALHATARNLLQVLALAGQPLPVDVALTASGADYRDVDLLRGARLLRGSEAAGGRRIECYHDRVRESLEAALPAAERMTYFQRLARALDHSDELELHSRCLEGAGELEAAARRARAAAEQAAASLAFDRAAMLYRRALQLHAPAAGERFKLMTALGEALENAGQGSEAAAAYEEAATLTDGDARLDLRRRAADQFLATGLFEEGTMLLRAVSSELDIQLPHTANAALVSLAASQLELGVRTLGRFRASRRVPRELEELRMRCLRTGVGGLSNYLPAHAMSLASQYLLAASKYDAPDHLVRALGYAVHLHTMFDPGSTVAAGRFERMFELAQREGHSELVGFANVIAGTSAHHREEGRIARGHLQHARELLRECTGVEWELDAANAYDQLVAAHCGDYAEIARSTPLWLEQAQRRGRVWAETMFSAWAGIPAWLNHDDVEGYRKRLVEVRNLWKSRAYVGWPQVVLMYGEALLELYTGDYVRAFELVHSLGAAREHRVITRITAMGAVGYSTNRGRCAAAALTVPGLDASFRQELFVALAESIATLRKRGRGRAHGIAAMLEAARSYYLGERERALSQLRAAITALERAGLNMHVAAARLRLGELLGGAEGQQYVSTAQAFMRGEGIREVDRMTELNCPGFAMRQV